MTHATTARTLRSRRTAVVGPSQLHAKHPAYASNGKSSERRRKLDRSREGEHLGEAPVDGQHLVLRTAKHAQHALAGASSRFEAGLASSCSRRVQPSTTVLHQVQRQALHQVRLASHREQAVPPAGPAADRFIQLSAVESTRRFPGRRTVGSRSSIARPAPLLAPDFLSGLPTLQALLRLAIALDPAALCPPWGRSPALGLCEFPVNL